MWVASRLKYVKWKKLYRLHKYFELSSVGDKTIFDKLYFIEKSLTENNLRQTKVTEFFQS